MQVRQPVDVAHVIGWFFLGAMFVAAIGVSAVLSAMYFSTITPPDQGWLVWLFLSFTEIGMIGWLAAFFLMKHHGFHKGLSLLMACAHGGASFVIASVQLNHLIHHTSPGTGGAAFNAVGTTLEIIFALDLLAVFVDVISRYFEVPGHYFRNPPLPYNQGASSVQIQPGNNFPGGGNLNPRPTIQEIKAQRDWVTGQFQAMPGGSKQIAGPLAHPQLPQRAQAVAMSNQQQVATPSQEWDQTPVLSRGTVRRAASAVGSFLMRKANGSMNYGEQEGLVPGNQNETTSESGLPSESYFDDPDLMPEDKKTDIYVAAYRITKAKERGLSLPEFVRQMKGLDEQGQPVQEGEEGEVEEEESNFPAEN